MIGAVRALVSVVMLAGFYVVALVQLAALVVIGFLVHDWVSGLAAVKLVVPVLIASIGALAVAMWRAIRDKPELDEGVPLTEAEAPELWATVRELAAAVRTRMPDEIRLVPEVNAAVSEHPRLLGLLGGRRYLYIGLPLLQAMTVDQLRAVIAHELGHYSGMHTQLAGVAYRGRLTIAGTIGRLSTYNPLGWVFRGYARLYRLLDNVVSRRQELEADRAAVRVAGRTAAMSALRELPGLSAAWGFFFQRYVELGWTARFAPDDLFGGFGALLDARTDELAALREREPEDRSSAWDTHPPLGARVAAMADAPEVDRAADTRKAGALLPDLRATGMRMQEQLVDIADRQVLPWPDFTAAAIASADQRQADALFRAAARSTGTAQAGLETVLGLVPEGKLGDFAAPFFENATKREAAVQFAGPMTLLLRVAAVRSGAGRWQHSWSEPAVFTGNDGQPLGLREIAELAVSPDTLGEARKRLADLGIDPAAAAMVDERATARGAQVIAAMANVKIDDVAHDLLLLNNGFVFVSNPGDVDKGRERLRALVGSAPAEALAERHRFLPYEEIASTTIEKRTPIRATLTLHDGRQITLREKWDGEDLERNSRETLTEVLNELNG
ncbi:Zn-dependent protease with chaperone function [Asanoa hainanensis]|uniref:Zn-dependent protease with chaperone function n=1 Tax=Asanoa hainanensis TaxID=560556 RepID=A0A239JZW2_9ACTN|nr:M48 family metallopeptidase [Asanoa hainanensis]SNT11310.1 Zn-dependent protease with chaperone function [Asanoa hainanensis]